MKLLDAKVSWYENYFYSPDGKTEVKKGECQIREFILSDRYASRLAKIREIEDKSERDKLKKQLPCVTPSGQFGKRRKEEELIQHSSLIQFDLDPKENTNLDVIKDKVIISAFPFVCFCGLSASGRGLWGLVPISDPDKHSDHFRALTTAFAQLGYTLDQKPKNVSSLRGYSYDPSAHINEYCSIFSELEVIPEVIKEKKAFQLLAREKKRIPPQDSDQNRFFLLVLDEIVARGVDITANTEKVDYWFAIGCSIYSNFGASGIQHFHQISQFHPEYDTAETEERYNSISNHIDREYTFDPVFARAKREGILIKNLLSHEIH